MKKINFCKATTIILIINVILSIVLFFVVPDKIAIQWVGTSPSNAVDSYYVFLVPVLSVLFAFTGKPIFTMFLFRLWNRTNEHLVTYLNLCLQVVFLTCEIYIGLYNLCNFNVAISIILIVELMIDVVIGLKLFHNQSVGELPAPNFIMMNIGQSTVMFPFLNITGLKFFRQRHI